MQSYTAGKMIEGLHEILVVWPGWNQSSKGRVVNNGQTTVVYLESKYPGQGWTSINEPPKEIGKLVLVRRTSDEIHMARFTGDDWVVYFNNTNSVQSANNPTATELKNDYDPIVDWQYLPKTPQQMQFESERASAGNF